MTIIGRRRYQSLGYPNKRAPIVVRFDRDKMIYNSFVYACETARVMADRYGCARVEWDTLEVTYWRSPCVPDISHSLM